MKRLKRPFTFAMKETTLSCSFFIFSACFCLSLLTAAFGMNFFMASFYTVIENTMTHFPFSYSMSYNDENDGGLSELNLGYSMYIMSDSGTNITTSWGYFGSNLIGAYAVLGASRDGTM